MSISSEAAASRVRLVVAVKTMLADEDIRRPTTSKVAKLAGVAVGTIYNHFIDMDDLVAVAIADLIAGESSALGERLYLQARERRPGVVEHLERELALRGQGRLR
jgi:AcrR family transcriptional regulator